MKNKKVIGILFALLAAVFYSVSIPTSKLLLNEVSPVFMASFLYLGAGVGVGFLYLFRFKKESKEEKLDKKDAKYTLAMIFLDVLAPILMMIGINIGLSSNASLLGNFEIVATSLIAFFIFKESVSKRFWIAMSLITVASIILTFDFSTGFSFSLGSLLVLMATLCWGLENNCTKKISGKSSYQIVIIKGLCSGATSFVIALICGESFPKIQFIGFAMALGFIAYGLSIFMYVKAQKLLGAAKTSAYYAVSPFVGSFLAFLFVGESIGWNYLLALAIMIAGSTLVVVDTLFCKNRKLEESVAGEESSEKEKQRTKN